MENTNLQHIIAEQETVQKISDLIPPSGVILPEIDLLVQILYGVLDDANAVRLEFIKHQVRSDKKWLIDRLFEPPMMRYLLQSRLHEKDIEAQYWDDTSNQTLPHWEKQVLANNGLAGTFAGYPYRILKGDHGRLPPPGPSDVEKRFYSQPGLTGLQAYLIPPEGYPQDQLFRPNIVLLWEISKDGVPKLYLSVPLSADDDHAYAYYTEEIPHPVFGLRSSASDSEDAFDSSGMRITDTEEE